MAAPVPARPELELSHRLARLRRQRRRAARRIRRLRSPGAAGRHAFGARVTKVKRGLRRGDRRRSVARARRPARRRALRATIGPAAAAASRTSPTTRSSRQKQRQVRDALVRIGRIPEPPLEPIVPAAVAVRVPQQARVLVHGRGAAGRRSASTAPAAGTRCIEIEQCLADDRRSATRSATPFASGRARSGSTPTTRARDRVPPPSRRARGPEHGAGARACSSPLPASASSRDDLVEVLRRFPEVRSIHWAINDAPAEVTNLPTKLLWGEDAIEEEILGLRFRVRPNALPPDEHARWPSGSTSSRARVRRPDRRRDRLRPLLRHRNDRSRAGREALTRLGRRDLRGSPSPARSRTPS